VPCVLCGAVIECHKDLFFRCLFAAEVWKSYTLVARGTGVGTSLSQVASWLEEKALAEM